MRTDGYLMVGELAREAHSTPRTIRFYEEQELIRPTRRTAGGFRLYSTDQVARLELIGKLKELGLSLREIRDVLRAREEGSQIKSVAERLAASLSDQVVEAERKIRLYQEAKKDFEDTLKLLKVCRICELPIPCKECDILHAGGNAPHVVEAILS